MKGPGLPSIESRETQYSPPDFVSLHDKYSEEAETRSMVRLVQVRNGQNNYYPSLL